MVEIQTDREPFREPGFWTRGPLAHSCFCLLSKFVLTIQMAEIIYQKWQYRLSIEHKYDVITSTCIVA